MSQPGRVCSCKPWGSLHSGLSPVCGVNILGTTYYSMKHSTAYSELTTDSRELDFNSGITTDKFPAISSKYYRFLLNLFLCINLRLLQA